MSSWLEKMRLEAIAKRRLAENARRLARLMHQPQVKKDLGTQAAILEELAQELDDLLRQRVGEGGGAFAGLAPEGRLN